MALPLVDRERLLKGNWKIKPAAGKVFNRGWFKVVDVAPAGGREVRFWDFAATETKMKGDPDYTAGGKVRQIGEGDNRQWYILDVTYDQINPAVTNNAIKNLAGQDGNLCHVAWEEEGGASGKRDSQHIASMLAGYAVEGIRSGADKVMRAKGLASQAEAGNVILVRAPWNDTFLSQMHGFPETAHDDMVDAASGAFNYLVSPATTWQSLRNLGRIEKPTKSRWG